MKNKQLNCRIDDEVENIINEVMEEEELNKSAAVRHIATSYKNSSKHLTSNHRRAYAWYIANMETAINEIPEEYRGKLNEIMGGFKCQI